MLSAIGSAAFRILLGTGQERGVDATSVRKDWLSLMNDAVRNGMELGDACPRLERTRGMFVEALRHGDEVKGPGARSPGQR